MVGAPAVGSNERLLHRTLFFIVAHQYHFGRLESRGLLEPRKRIQTPLADQA
jgi:hypothetical protein